ncbi:MAG TPA: Tex family protein [Gammaproteobacteria bacterium]|nr:Tex family protein [Gammaproteobacteria bacterium]
MNINNLIATELNIKIEQVAKAIELLDGGDTVPFISRYRKEVTGGLTDTDLRTLEERLSYLRELQDRRQTILKSISEQGKLTPELEASILQADNKATLEDLYLPYKPKRRTKAQIAKEAGLEPLALQLLAEPSQIPEQLAGQFINTEKNINNATEALEGARHILLELFSENSDLLGYLRDYLWQHGVIKSEVIKEKETSGHKFADYFNYQEPIKKIPSHRALALLRGQNEGVLRIALTLNASEESHCQQKIQQQFVITNQQRPADAWLIDTAALAWRAKIFLKLEVELIVKLRELAEEEAIKVFANNLKNLLMTSPAGSRVTLGLDPGLRTGVKVVVIDGTGKLLHHTNIFPHAPRNDWDGSIDSLAKLCKQFKVELISIGNGTASRETDKLVLELKKRHPELKLTSIVISEAGASVYSASELAAQEFPSLDVTYRGAVSIARRLQDPLAELVKIDPKAIGVGQYQHDVNQVKLSRTLHAVMEDCVNGVGVDVNTASVPLLSCVAGLNESVAKNIVLYRDENGRFNTRQQLKKVPRLGEKAFEQAAGFLRITNGDNPLDASAVHPEAYSLVERILAQQQKTCKEIMGNRELLKAINAKDFIDAQFGLPTITDILQELEKPGRDPRPEFKMATFKEGVETLTDLTVGMVLEGVVTNVANFGAFVDIGVHQDGLVHISMLADRFVKDPHDVVKVGQIVTVKVLEVDLARKRIQLSMRLSESPATSQPAISPPKKTSTNKIPSRKKLRKPEKAAVKETTLGNVLLAALAKQKEK